jgi:hypothetical protein
MLAGISYGRKIVEDFKGIQEISKEVNNRTVLARQLNGDGSDDFQPNEVDELLKAHTEKLLEKEPEQLITTDKGEQQESGDNKAYEQRLMKITVSCIKKAINVHVMDLTHFINDNDPFSKRSLTFKRDG